MSAGNGTAVSSLAEMHLSSQQREAQRVAMINQINATTHEVQALLKDQPLVWGLMREHESRLDALAAEQRATQQAARVFYGASMWRRLRWLVTGR